jgi:phage protein U
MYAQLGDIVFDGLFSFHEYEDTGETRFAQVDLVTGKPDLQHTGEELDTITFNIRLHESFCEPSLRYGQFHSHRKNADILPFVDGYGNVIGNFVIEKIKRTVNQTDTHGRVILCECDVTLKEYVDPNRLLSISNNAKTNAFALNAKSLSINIEGPAPNANADIFKSMQALLTSTYGTRDSITKAAADPSNIASYLKSALVSVNSVREVAVNFKSKIEGYVSQGAGDYTGMVDGLTAIETNISLLKTSILAGNIPAAITNVDLLNAATGSLNTIALPIQKLLILR